MQNRLNSCNLIRIRHLLIVMSILGNVIFFPADSPAGEYPEAGDIYVNDYAQLLTPEDAAGIRTMFTTLGSDQGIEAVVLTIGSFRKYETEDTTLEAFATNLFNT